MCKGRCLDRRYNRRRVMQAGGGGLAGLSLAGGLATPFGGFSPAATAAQDVAEVIWYTQQGVTTEYNQEFVVDQFNAAHPEINLVQEPVPGGGDMDRIVSTALQAGAGPDIVPSDGPAHAGILAQAGLLLPLDDYAEQYGWADRLLPWAVETGRFDGQLYLLPHQFETTITFYGEKQFADNGWSLPTNRQEFEDLATEAVGNGIVPVAAGTGDCSLCTNWLVTVFFNHYAGPDAVYQALTGEIQFSDPIFVEAIELLNQYMQAGWIGGSVEQYFATSFDSVNAQLIDGSALMQMSGTWFLDDVEAAFTGSGTDNTWNWAQNPSFRDEVPYPLFPIGIGSTLSISASSEHPDAAAQFLDWYYSDPLRITTRIAEGGADFVLPIPYEQEDLPESMDPRLAELLQVLTDATASGNFGYLAWSFWPSKTHVYLHDEVQKVFTNELSPADYCEGMATLFSEELAAGVVPTPIPRG